VLIPVAGVYLLSPLLFLSYFASMTSDLPVITDFSNSDF
jgi:hypothetical protein